MILHDTWKLSKAVYNVTQQSLGVQLFSENVQTMDVMQTLNLYAPMHTKQGSLVNI